MNPNLEKLFRIAQKESRLVLGLMSGTSLDGLDIALCKVSGSGFQTRIEILKTITHPFEDTFKSEIRLIFAKRTIDFQQLCLLNEYIAEVHAELINQTLIEWNLKSEDIDLLGSHGQTVYHAPKSQHGIEKFPNATLQIGDGDHLAVKTGIITISDFRQKHIAAGGEGAPLAVYGDLFLFSNPDSNRVLVNIGGISNYTYLPKNTDATSVYTTDTGPGNVLMDLIAREYFNIPFDSNGQIARTGSVNDKLLNALLEHSFFENVASKTTGPEVFNKIYLENALATSGQNNLSGEDLLATMLELTAKTLSENILSKIVKGDSNEVFVSGGGAQNSLLMERLSVLLSPITVASLEVLGFSADSKEAMLFAVLANECIAGELPYKSGVFPMASFGKISFPN